MKTPDITPAQIVAIVQPFVTAAIALAVAFGVDLTELQQTAILGFAGALAVLLSVALVFADAMIRRGRAQVVVAREEGDTARDVEQLRDAGKV